MRAQAGHAPEQAPPPGPGRGLVATEEGIQAWSPVLIAFFLLPHLLSLFFHLRMKTLVSWGPLGPADSTEGALPGWGRGRGGC